MIQFNIPLPSEKSNENYPITITIDDLVKSLKHIESEEYVKLIKLLLKEVGIGIHLELLSKLLTELEELELNDVIKIKLKEIIAKINKLEEL